MVREWYTYGDGWGRMGTDGADGDGGARSMRPPPPAPLPRAVRMGKVLLGTEPSKQPFVINADFGLGMALRGPLERTNYNTMRDGSNDPEHDPENSRGEHLG